MQKVCITTLGCDKNTCDSEALAGALRARGVTLVSNDKDADIIVVNTCAFIKSARTEAIRVIKSKFKYGAKVVVTGCITVNHRDLIPSGAEVWEIGKFSGQKLLSTPGSYAYIKISDGCNNNCSYCTIPSIRGKFRARDEMDIYGEVAHFAKLGVGEFILVAQDLTKYPTLVPLIQKISRIRGVQRIRLHYVYPNGITDELIAEVAYNDKVCKYLDIPFQHVSPRILKLMNRKGGVDEYFALVQKLRERIPGITIRSTFMVGFPTETEEDFKMLCDFLKTARLDYVGFFAYSREVGTPAYSMPQTSRKTKTARLKAIQALQNNIRNQIHESIIGKTVKVVCDFCDDVLGYSITRCEHLSPDVDPVIIVKGTMKVGEYANARITETSIIDLIGELI
jgi:ribosomal protein S12 methylthiotransferase